MGKTKLSETPETERITPQLVDSSTASVFRAYDEKKTDTLASLRTRKFLAGNSGLLLRLPPTDDSLEQHIK